MMWLCAGMLWLGLVALAHWVHDNPRGDTETGLFYRGEQLYAAIFHRLTATGQEHIPAGKTPGPLIVIVNHTAGIDPILVQAAMKCEPRWMMGADMAAPDFDWFWRWSGMIPVDRTGSDRTSLRTAVRHVESGGVLGIFPEGRIERPARKLLPFMPGVGLIVKKTGALVLPVILRDTPDCEGAMESFLKFSRSRIEFKPVIDYRESGLSAEGIAKDLESCYAAWTGWERAESPER